MDWLTFVEKIASHLAWPSVILVVACLFKPQLIRVIDNLESLKAQGFEAKFRERAVVLKAQADLLEITSGSQEPQGLDSSTPRGDRDQRRALESDLIAQARRYPTAAIAESWALVENAILRLAQRVGVDPLPPSRVLSQLEGHGVATPAVVHLVEGLRQLKDEATATADKVRPDAAALFVRTAVALTEALNRVDR